MAPNDTFAEGDNYYVSSNGWPVIVTRYMNAYSPIRIPDLREKGIATFPGAASITISSPRAYNTNVILLTYISLDGANANVFVRNIVAGTSFDIVSSRGADNNKVAWSILYP